MLLCYPTYYLLICQYNKWYTGYMRFELPQTKNKSDDEPRELNFTFSCFFLWISKALSQIKTPNRYGTAYVDIIEKNSDLNRVNANPFLKSWNFTQMLWNTSKLRKIIFRIKTYNKNALSWLSQLLMVLWLLKMIDIVMVLSHNLLLIATVIIATVKSCQNW